MRVYSGDELAIIARWDERKYRRKFQSYLKEITMQNQMRGPTYAPETIANLAEQILVAARRARDHDGKVWPVEVNESRAEEAAVAAIQRVIDVPMSGMDMMKKRAFDILSGKIDP